MKQCAQTAEPCWQQLPGSSWNWTDDSPQCVFWANCMQKQTGRRRILQSRREGTFICLDVYSSFSKPVWYLSNTACWMFQCLLEPEQRECIGRTHRATNQTSNTWAHHTGVTFVEAVGVTNWAWERLLKIPGCWFRAAQYKHETSFGYMRGQWKQPLGETLEDHVLLR